MPKSWIVYDERAMLMDTDECAVLEACRSEHEAMHKALPGIVFEYDVTKDNELVNERLIGPNHPWLRENTKGGHQ